MKNFFQFDGPKDNRNFQALAFCPYVNGQLRKKRIGIKLLPSDFNRDTQRVVRSHPDHKKINERLSKIESEFEKLKKITGDESITNHDLALLIRAVKSNKTVNDLKLDSDLLIFWMNKYREERTRTIDSSEIYKYVIKSLLLYQEYKGEEISFGYLAKNSEAFRDDFVKFLKTTLVINGKKKRENKPGSVVNKIEKINTVINWYNRINSLNISRLKSNINNDNQRDDSDISHLDANEFHILFELWKTDQLGLEKNEWIIFGRFLFRCITGLRIGEQTNHNLRRNDFQKSITFFSSKTKKNHTLPLFKQAKEIGELIDFNWYDFHNYLDKKAKTFKENNLVRSVVGKYLNDRKISFYSYQKKELKTFGLHEKISSHSARKTFGTLIYKHTNNVFVTAKFLNHSDLKHTIVYLGISLDDLTSYVKDLKIGGESVMNQDQVKENRNPVKAFGILLDKIIHKDKFIALEFSNIILSFKTFRNLGSNKDRVQKHKLDNKYLLKGDIFIKKEENLLFLINVEVIDQDSNLSVKRIEKGLFEILLKGLKKS
jgi:integrase